MTRVRLLQAFCLCLVLPVIVLCQNNTLPHTCDSDDQCSFLWPNSMCNTDGVCECASGYCVNSNGVYCEKVKIGTGCPPGAGGDSFCQSGVTDALCDSRYGVCRCPDGQGNVAGDGFNRCAAGMKLPACETCISTGGTCQDLNADDTPDKCGCPEFFTSSDPEDSLATGCDLKEVPTGACCSAEGGEIKCADPNAQCTYANDLSVYHYCTCKLGFVAVPRDYDPTHADCRRIINEILDPDCSACVANGGTCYTMNDDGTMDGCLCSAMTSSSAPGAEFACDTKHLMIDCSNDDPMICFVPGVDPRFQHLYHLLISGVAKMYVRGHADNFYCQFQSTFLGVCIQQSHAVAHCPSGSETKEGKSFLTHATWMFLQYNAHYISPRDICLYAYCRYDKFSKVSTSEVIVAERKLISSEGIHVKPSLILVATDKFGISAEIEGIKLGDLLKLKITMTDNQGIYTSHRAETCIVSDHVSLNLATTQAVVFIQDSCPKTSSFLTKGTNFFPVFGDSSSIETGFFTVPKFATSDYLFFHCAVRVCIDPKNCEPLPCHDAGSVTKRSVSGPITLPKTMGQLVTYRLSKRSEDSSMYDMNRALESPELTRKTIGVRVINEDSHAPPRYSDVWKQEHQVRSYEDNYYDQGFPAPAGEEKRSFSMLIISVLTSVLVTLLVTALIFFVCFIVPKHTSQSASSNKSDVAE